ncbi:MAG: OstA-like protein [Thermonemataceae bacterium]
MSLNVKVILLSAFFFFSLSAANAQDDPKGKDRKVAEDDTVRYQKLPYDTVTFEKGEVVELKKADTMIGVGDTLIKVIGNVLFKQGNVKLYCDSAYKYQNSNNVEAFGSVRLIQDSITLVCERIFYLGDERLAQAREDVVLRDPKMTLYTDFLDYSLNSKIGYYYNGGRVIDSQNNLKSLSGTYDTQAKFFFFKDDVNVVGRNKGTNYTITSDTLQYNEVNKIAYFKGPTNIVSSNGNIYAEKGTYRTLTQISNFSGRSEVENEKYILKGDSIYYDEQRVQGYARGNAEVFVKKDSIFINGHEGYFWGPKGLTKMLGDPYMRNVSKGDTLFLSADTLISYNKKVFPKNQRASAAQVERRDSLALTKERRLLLAYNRVKIYKTDLQGKCDSLAYNFRDSTIYFYRDPVLWNTDSQMTADSIRLLMANDELDRLEMRVNSFIISQDSVENFNQLKGRTVDAYFEENQITLMDVNGNGETIYFLLEEEDQSMIGMYRVICSNIKGFFEENQLVNIAFYINVDGKVIPPHELQEPDTRLTGFLWRIEEKPLRETVLIRDEEEVKRIKQRLKEEKIEVEEQETLDKVERRQTQLLEKAN